MEDPKTKKELEKEELEKQEHDRLENLACAQKELEVTSETPTQDQSETDEQDSDGSANAFENK